MGAAWPCGTPCSCPDGRHAHARGEPGEQVDLPDGRKLGYCLPDNFDPSGRVVVVIHGTPECRLAKHIGNKYIAEHKHPGWYPSVDYQEKRSKELGIQHVPIDRWGVGLSSFKGDGTVADIGADIVALCDHLGVDKFVVQGGSRVGPTCGLRAVIDPASHWDVRPPKVEAGQGTGEQRSY